MSDRRRLLILLLSVIQLASCRSGGATHAASPAAETRLAARLDEIFTRGEWTPRAFGPARWDGETSYLTAEPSPTKSGASELVRYDAASGARTVVIAAERLVPSGAQSPLVIEDYAFSSDARRVLVFTNSKKVWRQNTRGDFWALELGTGALKKLGGDAPESSLMFAKLSPDGTRAGYVRANDLYVEDLVSGTITRLTSDGSATTINGTSDWVYEEEFDLRDGWRWSPDGRSIAFWHFDSSGVELYPLINTTDSLYPKIRQIPYPKAGQTNSAVTVGVIGAAGGPAAGEVRWIKLPGDPRQVYVPRMEWVEASGELMLQQLNRHQNENIVWLADASTGAVRELLHDRDAAWLDVVDDWRWLPGGEELLWISERDGWRHAWAVSRDGAWRCLTEGAFDLQGVVGVDGRSSELYFLASREGASDRAWAGPFDDTPRTFAVPSAQRFLYRVSLAGGSLARVTPAGEPGTHTYDLAPGAAFALHTVSRLDRPPAVELVRLPGHERVRMLEANDALAAKMGTLAVQPTEFLRVEIEPGVELDGWMMKPRDFDPARRYPLVMHVYGEPSNVQANDVWRGVRGLFHHALAEAGYVVACVDNRGTSAPRGRAWRKSSYQCQGTLGSSDQAAAVRALLAARPYLDASRVCSWGWSGGGTMTLNQMFRHPELYQVGLAVAPVPDLTLYDSIYQERYTGLPQESPEAYRANSPITYASGLAGSLLLVHGSGDDNVHMQGSERLINRLVELGKPFDFMMYPNRNHAIAEGPGTLHHVYALLARYLEEHLPPGPR